MTRLTIRQVKKIIRKKAKWWIHWLGLGYWHVTLHFEKDLGEKDNGYFVAGKCECDWRYKTAHVYIVPKSLRYKPEKELEEILVHELMHIFLNEMREGDISHEESAATMLQKAFTWVRNAKS